MEKKSGKHWVQWANVNALNSTSIWTLDQAFKSHVENFINALKDAGASVNVEATRRSNIRAYLFHWSWKIYLKKCRPSEAKQMKGVDIEWDHGDKDQSINGAKEMVEGFGLAIPPASTVAPSLTSNHIFGKAIDMDIVWFNKIKVKKKNGKLVEITYNSNANLNNELIEVGRSYGVLKLRTDKPHWSSNGG